MSDQWESAWWLGRSLQGGGERERKEGDGCKGEREREECKNGDPTENGVKDA